MNFTQKVHIKKSAYSQKFILRRKEGLLNFRIKKKLKNFWDQKKAFFNSISWYRDDLSIVFTKLGWPKK